MKTLVPALVLSLCALMASTASAAPLARNVIIVSMDGFRPDAILRDRTPNLWRLLHDGAYTLHARTTLPSVTLPSHTSMLSGVDPKVHGVTWNSEKPKGKLKVPTILELAAREGFHTAVIAAKVRFLQIIPDRRLTEFEHPGYTSAAVAGAAERYLPSARPCLALLHLEDTDEVGHKSGWMSGPYMQAAETTDRALGRILKTVARSGMSTDTLIIVTADHGGKGFSHGSADRECVLIPWIAIGPHVREGHEVKGPVVTYDTAATALWALGLNAPRYFKGHPLTDAFDVPGLTAADPPPAR